MGGRSRVVCCFGVDGQPGNEGANQAVGGRWGREGQKGYYTSGCPIRGVWRAPFSRRRYLHYSTTTTFVSSREAPRRKPYISRMVHECLGIAWPASGRGVGLVALPRPPPPRGAFLHWTLNSTPELSVSARHCSHSPTKQNTIVLCVEELVIKRVPNNIGVVIAQCCSQNLNPPPGADPSSPLPSSTVPQTLFLSSAVVNFF